MERNRIMIFFFPNNRKYRRCLNETKQKTNNQELLAKSKIVGNDSVNPHKRYNLTETAVCIIAI